MWIWELGSSSGGSIPSILAMAHQYGIGTVTVKSGDGTGTWSQFNRQLVSTLHAHGLKVCAWQFVYGDQPIAEAQVGAAAVNDGADCLLIDAEGQYEGKYVQAQSYIAELRKLIGPNFPVGLAGFPYVDFHPAFPYSVFLGPGGAQYNTPQMYWVDIGTTVDAVFAHTYSYNRPYGRPIYPLGQVYNYPPARQIRRFRQLSRAYGAPNVSWWDWQESSPTTWGAISQRVGTLAGYAADTSLASLAEGDAGDLVVWAQEHLVSASQHIGIDGQFGPNTLGAVRRFQHANGIPMTGIIDGPTWTVLLRYAPVHVRWVAHKSGQTASLAAASGSMPVPKSASLPAKRDEIAGAGGAGADQKTRRRK